MNHHQKLQKGWEVNDNVNFNFMNLNPLLLLIPITRRKNTKKRLIFVGIMQVENVSLRRKNAGSYIRMKIEVDLNALLVTRHL